MVTVYTKPQCVQCTATHRWLKSRGVTYNTVDIQDEDIVDYLQDLGHLQAPVVVTPTESWSGFRPDKLASLV